MNFKNIYRKAFIAAATLAPAAVFAEETSGSGTDDTLLTSMLTSIQTAMTDALEAAGPVVTGVIVAGLGLWIAIALVGVLKRAFGAGKGR